MDYTHIAQELLATHHYLCLASTDATGKPWASPLSYVYDGKMTLYYISHIHALHSKNIDSHPEVAFSIFETSQVPGNAFGVQGSGKARRIEASDIPEHFQIRLTQLVSLVILEKEHSFYQIDITDIYLPDANRWKQDGNIRTPITLV